MYYHTMSIEFTKCQTKQCQANMRHTRCPESMASHFIPRYYIIISKVTKFLRFITYSLTRWSSSCHATAHQGVAGLIHVQRLLLSFCDYWNVEWITTRSLEVRERMVVGPAPELYLIMSNIHPIVFWEWGNR